MIRLTAADGLGPEVTDDFIFTVNKFPQEVTFDAIGESTFGDADITLVGSASSGLDVVFGSSNTDVATIDGNVLTIVGAGESIISAVQPGTETLARVVVEQNLIVNKADQTITFNEISDVAIGDITSFDLTGIGFASSGLPVSYESSDESVVTISGETVTLVGSGLAAIIATQEGNEDFNPAESVFRILTVNPRVLGLGDQIEQLHPYPNPAKDYLNIDIAGVDGKLELQLLDLNGRAVENGYSLQSTGNIIRLDVRQLAAGTYLLEVQNNDESVRYKFVKD